MNFTLFGDQPIQLNQQQDCYEFYVLLVDFISDKIQQDINFKGILNNTFTSIEKDKKFQKKSQE